MDFSSASSLLLFKDKKGKLNNLICLSLKINTNFNLFLQDQLSRKQIFALRKTGFKGAFLYELALWQAAAYEIAKNVARSHWLAICVLYLNCMIAIFIFKNNISRSWENNIYILQPFIRGNQRKLNLKCRNI